MSRSQVARFAITCTHILRGDGSTKGEMPDWAQDREWLVRLYRAMGLTRTFDVKAIALQRQGYRIWSRTSFQRVVIGSGPAVQRWEGRLKGHIKLGHVYQEANLTRASSRER